MAREKKEDSKISDIIARLEKLKEIHGDINVVVEEKDDYWGSLHNYISESNMQVSEHAQPAGPKSGISEKAVVISYS